MAEYPNGRAPASALINIYGCVASPDMARRVRYVKEEYDRTHADNLIINEIYRTFEQQVYQRERWTNLGQPNNAAVPGYSNHGAWDIGAVDWSCSDVAARREIAARVGLIHNISNESWHAAALGTISVPLPDLAGLNYTTIQEDDMYNDVDRYRDNIVLGAMGRVELSTYTINQKLDALLAKADLILWATTDEKGGLRQMVGNLTALVEKAQRNGGQLTAAQTADLGELVKAIPTDVIEAAATPSPKALEAAARAKLSTKPSILALATELENNGITVQV